MMFFCSRFIQAQLISHPVAESSLVVGQKSKVGGVDAGRNFFSCLIQCSNSDCICIFAFIYYGL